MQNPLGRGWTSAKAWKSCLGYPAMEAATVHPRRTRVIVIASVVTVEASWFGLLAYIGLRLVG